jgi:hypothetical protein
MSNKPELELKHILPYLPYKLKCNEKWTLISLSSLEDHAMFDYSARFDGENKKGYIQFLKPMLRPMSDLFKDIVHNGRKVNASILLRNSLESSSVKSGKFLYPLTEPLAMPYFLIQVLFKYHFDVFGLIEKGLAEPIKNK